MLRSHSWPELVTPSDEIELVDSCDCAITEKYPRGGGGLVNFHSFDGAAMFVSKKNGIYYNLEEQDEQIQDNLPRSFHRDVFYSKQMHQLGTYRGQMCSFPQLILRIHI